MGQLRQTTLITGPVKPSPLSPQPGEKPSEWAARVAAAAAAEAES